MSAFTIRGAGGGGKGGEGGRVAKEDADSLRSKQYATIIDALCEGEIGGLVNGLGSVYLNDTPIANPDGSLNFKDVSFFFSPGTQTLGVDELGRPKYFGAGGAQVTNAVSTEVKKAISVVRSVTNPEVDWVEVTIGIPQMITQNRENGDITGSSVAIAIDVQSDGGGFVPQNLSSSWGTEYSTIGAGHYSSNSSFCVGAKMMLECINDKPENHYKFVVEYRAIGATVWTPITLVSTSNSGRTFALGGGGWAYVKATYTYQTPELPPAKYEFRLRNDGGVELPVIKSAQCFAETVYDTITGKCTSRYQRTYRIPLAGAGPWDIRVRRLTDDAPDSAVQNETWWDALTECVDVKLSYPNTAAVMLSIDAENFQSIPARGFEIYGLICRVPTNYNPVTRVYSGAWDGTFKMAWTDNPAWCFYDMVSSTRYGLGNYVDTTQIDKWGLYEIGRYCDELVPNGSGGFEPRFTCNLYIQTREDAFRVISSMTSIFRGMAFWASGQIMATQDSPRDSAALFTAANVIDGNFTYQGADHRARHTVALVSWNDPADMYRQKIEYVEDPEGIRRWGVIETEILAVGCTSRGQAHRVGKWLLFTEQNESETVTFKAGLDAARIAPGDVIETQDSSRAGRRLGGRVMASTVSTLTLDSEIEIEDGLSYQVSVVLPDGSIASRDVLNGLGASSVLQMAGDPLPELPVSGAIWVVTVSNLVPERWRVLGISESTATTVEISALSHNPSKFNTVEQDIVLDPLPTSVIRARPGMVTNIFTETQLFDLNDGVMSARIAVSWKAPAEVVSFNISWRRNNDNFKSSTCTQASFDIDNVPAGEYTIKIAAVNALGRVGDTVTVTHIVEASGVSADVENLRLDPNFLGKDLPLAWDDLAGANGYEIELRHPTTDELIRAESSSIPRYTYTYSKNVQDGGPRRSFKVRVRAKTLVGFSANWVMGTFSNPAPAVPAAVSAQAGPGQVSIMVERPLDEDLAGMVVWMGSTSDFLTVDANKIYQGPDNVFTKTQLSPGQQAYFKVAFFDGFGTTGLNASSAFAATPLAAGGVTKVVALPANPAAIGGELALFLDVSDVDARGLYGWDGTQWVSTTKLLDGSVDQDILADNAVLARHVVAGAITAEKMTVGELSAISANLGTATAGNFTLDSEGFIQAGAAGYASGTGIWMGYHGGAYKFRAGTPGASRLEWTGSAVNVYGPDGLLTMTSGVVDFTRLGNKPTTLGEISASEAAKLAGMELGATRNVFRGVWTVGMVLLAGEVTTYDGSSWTAKTGHTAALANKPPALPATSNTWWELLASVGATGPVGSSAVSVALSNESHVFPADSAGAVGNYSGSGTDIRVYEGSAPLIYDGAGTSNGTWTVSSSATNITVGGVTDSGTFATVGNHSLVGAGTDLAQVTYTITGKTTAGQAFTLTKAQSFSKSKSGANGQSATAYWLARSTASIQRSVLGSYTPPSVSFASYSATGSSAPNGYAGRFIIATSTDGINYTNDYTSSVDELNKSYAVPAGIKTLRVRLYLAGGTSTLVDEEVVPVVSDGVNGSNAVAAIVSNDSHVFPASASGVVSSYVNSGTTLRVYEGASELVYDGIGTSNGTWRATATSTNLTPGTFSGNGTFLTIGQHSGVADGTDTAAAAYTISGKTLAGATFTIAKGQTFSKSKAGADGPAGPVVSVTTSRSAAFTATDGALDGGQSNITLVAVTGGIASPAYVWSFDGFQTSPTNSGVSSQTVTAAQFGTAKSATVTCTVNGAFVDRVTIVRLEKSTASANATVGAPAGTSVNGVPVESLTTAVSEATNALENKLDKAGGEITGRVTLAVADGIFVGSDTNNGVYMGTGGLLSKKAGITKFALEPDGDAIFAGALDAATGTFAGTMTADAVNAVNTINLAGNAVTIPVQATWAGTTGSNNQLVATSTVNFEGKPVIILAQIGAEGWSSDDRPWIRARVYRDGSPISVASFQSEGMSTLVFIDTPPAGNHNYGVGGVFAGTVVVAKTATIAVIGAKR